MRHGSLFSGIGGFDLAAEWMGWENVFHCEKEPFCQRVLKYYWPQAKLYDDITTTDFTIHREGIDILTGGFPCQPYSQAGKRLGKEDDRHLWPEMLRAVREIAPSWVVGENVRGLVNWNRGLVFNEVQADLEAAGYEVQPFLLPAAGVGAPHRRDRIWFVAHACTKYCPVSIQQRGQKPPENFNISWENEGEFAADTSIPGLPIPACGGLGCIQSQERESKRRKPRGNHSEGNGWQNFPTQPPVCSGNDGISSELDGITFPKWRAESIKGYGNAVVLQVVHQIFRAIELYGRTSI